MYHGIQRSGRRIGIVRTMRCSPIAICLLFCREFRIVRSSSKLYSAWALGFWREGKSGSLRNSDLCSWMNWRRAMCWSSRSPSCCNDWRSTSCMWRCRLAIGWGRRACRSSCACWILEGIFTWWRAWIVRSREKKRRSGLFCEGVRRVVSSEWCLTRRRVRWTLDAGWTRSAVRWCRSTKMIWFSLLISCIAVWRITIRRLAVYSAFLSFVLLFVTEWVWRREISE